VNQVRQSRALLLTILAWLSAAVALAGEGGGWTTLDQARLRLVDGGMKGEQRLAGVQFDLSPGWKTYWRVPGESGVPPVFDWSGSANLKQAEVLWPAPSRHHDEGGEAIGYKDRVIFPVEVVASDPAQPVSLRLSLQFAVCQSICIPAEAKMELTLPATPASTDDRQLVLDALARVPAAAGGAIDVKETMLEPAPEREGYDLVVQLEGTGNMSADIFVEGYPDAYFAAPKPLDGAAQSTYRLPVLGLKRPAELVGKRLTLTVVAGGRSVVRSVVVR
jgi:DsbC/DsbD-like thiol-disulfide interchange protein